MFFKKYDRKTFTFGDLEFPKAETFAKYDQRTRKKRDIMPAKVSAPKVPWLERSFHSKSRYGGFLSILLFATLTKGIIEL